MVVPMIVLSNNTSECLLLGTGQVVIGSDRHRHLAFIGHFAGTLRAIGTVVLFVAYVN